MKRWRDSSFRAQVKSSSIVARLYQILRFLVIWVMIAQFFNGNFENVFLCILTLILFLVPSFIERKIQIDLPDTLEVIILLFIFAAEILGEIRAYYISIPYWDTMLHTLNGFLCAAIGFSLLDILNRHERLSFSLSPLYLAIMAFCFSMTIGVLWEFFECTMDVFFHLDMQKDTVVNTISSVMLDPNGGNVPTAIRGITGRHCGHRGRKRDPAGPGRLSGYRHSGYHEGPVREFYRRSGLFLHRLLLCKVPGQGTLRPALHPPGASRNPQFRTEKIMPGTYASLLCGYTKIITAKEEMRYEQPGQSQHQVLRLQLCASLRAELLHPQRDQGGLLRRRRSQELRLHRVRLVPAAQQRLRPLSPEAAPA